MLAASQNRTWWTLFKARNLNPCCMMIIGRGNERYVTPTLLPCHQQHLDKRNCSPSSSSSIDTSKLVRCFWHFVSSDEIVCWSQHEKQFSIFQIQHNGWSSRRWNRRPKVNFNRSRPVKVVWQKFISRSSELEGIGSKIEKCLDFKVI